MKVLPAKSDRTSRMVAKIASDMQKPDGPTVFRLGEVYAFLGPLSVGKMYQE